jgi:hypothetical protein
MLTCIQVLPQQHVVPTSNRSEKITLENPNYVYKSSKYINTGKDGTITAGN